MSLLSSFQAELGTLANGASLTTDIDCTPSGGNDNAVLISAGPENLNYNFGTAPVGTTKFRIYLKKSIANASDSSIGVNLLGSGSPQYGVVNQSITTEGLHYIEIVTLPTAGNNTMNIDGNKIIVDRIEWHDNNVSSISITNETLATVAAGTNANAINLTAPTTSSCADQNSRKVTAIGSGITLKKGGVTMSVNDTFNSTDVLTYDIVASEPAITGHQIFKYVAVGACGDSNEATISANVTAAAGSITISNATLPSVTVGQTGVAVSFAAPVASNCADTGNRVLVDNGVGVVVKKNGNTIGQGATFTSSDVITFDVPSNISAQSAYNILTYKVVGVCGDSNQAVLSANVTAAAGSITISNATLPNVTVGQTGVTVSFVAPVTSNCADTGNRVLVDNGVGIVVKKNGNTIGQGATFTSSDVITFDVPSNIPAQSAYNILTYKVVGVCGDSNQAVLSANVTAAVTNSATVVNQTIVSMASASTGNSLGSLTAPVISGSCAFSGVRRLTLLSAGVTFKKNGNSISVGTTWASSDTITIDIDSSITVQTGKELFRYVAEAACGDSNVAVISADITAAVVSSSITIVGQTIPSITVGTSGNSMVTLSTPIVTGSCSFSGTRRLTSIGGGFTIKKNNVAMIVGSVWTSSDIITFDLDNTVLVQTGKELFRYVAVGACGDSNEAIVLGNIVAAISYGGGFIGGGSIVIDSPSPALTAASNTKSSISILPYLLGAALVGAIAFVATLIFGGKKRKKDKS